MNSDAENLHPVVGPSTWLPAHITAGCIAIERKVAERGSGAPVRRVACPSKALAPIEPALSNATNSRRMA